MGYTVRVNHPHFPEGTEFSVGTLGTVPNGGSKQVDEDEERAFLNVRGLPLHEAYEGDHAITVEGSPSLDKSEIDQVKEFHNPPEEESEYQRTTAEEAPASGRSVFTPPTPAKKEGEENDGGDN